MSITLTLHPTCVNFRAAAAVSGGTLSANESQVWATVNGVSKRVRITFWECETWKKEDKLWSGVMSYFWVDCSSKEKGSFKEKLMYVSEQREEKQGLFRTLSLEWPRLLSSCVQWLGLTQDSRYFWVSGMLFWESVQVDAGYLGITVVLFWSWQLWELPSCSSCGAVSCYSSAGKSMQLSRAVGPEGQRELEFRRVFCLQLESHLRTVYFEDGFFHRRLSFKSWSYLASIIPFYFTK